MSKKKDTKPYRPKNNEEKEIDRIRLLERIVKHSIGIKNALENMNECDDIWLSDKRSLNKFRFELQCLTEENVLNDGHDFDGLSWEEKENTTYYGVYERYKEDNDE